VLGNIELSVNYDVLDNCWRDACMRTSCARAAYARFTETTNDWAMAATAGYCPRYPDILFLQRDALAPLLEYACSTDYIEYRPSCKYVCVR